MDNATLRRRALVFGAPDVDHPAPITLPRARHSLAIGVLEAATQRGPTTTPWVSAIGSRVYARMGRRGLGDPHPWERRL